MIHTAYSCFFKAGVFSRCLMQIFNSAVSIHNRLSYRIANFNPHYQGTYQVQGDFPVLRVEYLLPVGLCQFQNRSFQVIRQPLTEEKRAQPQGSRYGICDRQNGFGTVFPPPPPPHVLRFSRQYYSTYVQYLFIHHPRYQP